ncbi:hypothetical protein DL98DRAFT_267606 [Cadophora sp. DSE1049]|nr:hypothetical protein DL98DRAFT_267606 [Cadophora sp. DSE1049]
MIYLDAFAALRQISFWLRPRHLHPFLRLNTLDLHISPKEQISHPAHNHTFSNHYVSSPLAISLSFLLLCFIFSHGGGGRSSGLLRRHEIVSFCIASSIAHRLVFREMVVGRVFSGFFPPCQLVFLLIPKMRCWMIDVDSLIDGFMAVDMHLKIDCVGWHGIVQRVLHTRICRYRRMERQMN